MIVIPPGRQTTIGQIPVAITDDHNEVYYYWQDWKVQDAVLFHVDAHPDTNRGAPPLDELLVRELGDRLNYFLCLDLNNFVGAAFYDGICSSMYWLNPHSERRLQYMGSNLLEEKERCLWAYLSRRYLNYEHIVLRADPLLFDEDNNYQGIVKKPGELSFNDGQQLLLDFDLDAFCCSTADIAGVPKAYRAGKCGVQNYTQRIEETLEILAGLGKIPTGITITRSSGKRIEFISPFMEVTRRCGTRKWDDTLGRYYFQTNNFVPPELVAQVEKQLLTGLERLYQ